MAKKRLRRQKNSRRLSGRGDEERWRISEEDQQMFLEAVESLVNNDQSLVKEKFDLMEEGSFAVRRRKASYREPGEQIKESLDLHGLNRAEAIMRLDEFCRQSARQGIRTLMVITGKGIHSLEGKASLKHEVILWLHSEIGRYLVECYRPGSRREGGEGVIILYLQRRNQVFRR
ncbi:MAG: Smr/MutS family protein [bacterium]